MTRRHRPGRAALGAVAVLAVAGPVLAGCGGQQSAPRSRVAAYITAVDHVEARFSAPVATVTRVSAAVSGRHAVLTEAEAKANARRLADAVGAMRGQQVRLRALVAPAPAARLRSLLLRYTAQEVALTQQLARLIAYLPRYASALAPLGPALRTLQAQLQVRSAAGTAAVAAVYAAKAHALRRFAVQAGAILAALHRVTPPQVTLPSYRAQLASLRGMAASAKRLAGALGGGAPGNVTPLLVGFDRAVLATRTVAVQKAEIAAIRAYDARSARLNRLAEAVSRERLRLAKVLH